MTIFQVIKGPVTVRESANGRLLQVDGKKVDLGTGYQFEADPTTAVTDNRGWVWLEHDRGWSTWRTADHSVRLVAAVDNDSMTHSLSFLRYGNPKGNSDAACFFNAFLFNAKKYLAEIQMIVQNDPQIQSIPNAMRRRRTTRYVMGQAVRRLIEEWKRVEPIYRHLYNSASASDKPNLFSLAIADIGTIAKDTFRLPEYTSIEVEFVPQHSTDFSILRANYYPDYALMSVPLNTIPFADAVKIIIHEFASLVVNPHSEPPLITEDTEQTFAPHELFPLLTADKAYAMPPIDKSLWLDGDDVHETYTLPIELGVKEHDGWQYFWTYWASKLFPDADGADLVARARPTRDYLTQQEEYPVDWRVSHLQEFVEDACSTLVFGNEIYDTYQEVFGNIYHDFETPDLLHPAPMLRLEVTFQLLKLEQGTDSASTLPDDLPSDRLDGRHDTIPGATAIAKWIHDHKSRLFWDTNTDSARRRLKQVSESLPKSLSELLADEPNVASSASFRTYEEVDLHSFAHIDWNAGTGKPVIDLRPPPIIPGGHS